MRNILLIIIKYRNYIAGVCRGGSHGRAHAVATELHVSRLAGSGRVTAKPAWNRTGVNVAGPLI